MNMKKTCLLVAAAGLVAASVSVANAQPYYVTGSALTPAWAPGTAANELTGSPLSLTTGTLTNLYHTFKVTGATWGDPNWPSSDCKINGDATGSNTFYFYPGTIGDGWFPLANRVGYANPGNAWELSGDFTSPAWGDDATALMSLGASNYFTVNYVVPTPGTHNFKFKTPGTWDGAVGQDFGSGAANISFATVTPNQSVEFNFDPAKGRYRVNIPPVTNTVVFAVDMSSQIALGNFQPGYNVYVAGAFNSWPGPTTGNGLALTNNPPYNGGSNTNIYYGTNVFIGLPGTAVTEYKFNQNTPGAPSDGWESSNNRTLTLLVTNGTEILPVATFSDTYAADFLNSPTPVLFSVDMTGAVGTDGSVFNPETDAVFINGQVTDPQWYAWYDPAPINPQDPAPANCQMVSSNSTMIYTNTLVLPAGTPLYFQYKYGMATNGIQNPLDNEAGAYINHTRVARNTGFNPCPLATDKFGVMFDEPFFTAGNPAGGQLKVGPAMGGSVPVQWLGRPGAQLQSASSLTGAWQTLTETDGTNWLIGSMSTNGFVSTTNWPTAGGQVFFRLVMPN